MALILIPITNYNDWPANTNQLMKVIVAPENITPQNFSLVCIIFRLKASSTHANLSSAFGVAELSLGLAA